MRDRPDEPIARDSPADMPDERAARPGGEEGSGLYTRSFARLLLDLRREAVELADKEAQLIRAETSQMIAQAAAGLRELVIGGVILFGGILIVLYAVIALLVHLLQPWPQAGWMSPLIIGVVASVIGILSARRGGKNIKTLISLPGRVGRSLRRDQEVIKENIK